VPDHRHILGQHVLEDMLAIVITIRARKNDHADVHVYTNSYRYSSMMVLARSFSHMDFT
jgi:hypothetical protein